MGTPPSRAEVAIFVVAPILFFFGLVMVGGATADLPLGQRLLIVLVFAATWGPVMYIRVRN